jgi:hypothetical protein
MVTSLSVKGCEMRDPRRFYVRWKVADLAITGEKLWSVIRMENSDIIEVGKFHSLHAAREALDADRSLVKASRPGAVETHSPQTFAEPGIWS